MNKIRLYDEIKSQVCTFNFKISTHFGLIEFEMVFVLFHIFLPQTKKSHFIKHFIQVIRYNQIAFILFHGSSQVKNTRQFFCFKNRLNEHLKK